MKAERSGVHCEQRVKNEQDRNDDMRLAIFTFAFALCLSSSVTAQEEDAAYVCLDNVGISTTWGQCLNQLFKPCADNEIGSEGHAACLAGLYETRFERLESEFLATLDVLPAQGREELTNILSAWYSFTGEKCSGVAASRDGSAAFAAEYGCQISESVLLGNELRRCRAGLSEELYCVGVQK